MANKSSLTGALAGVVGATHAPEWYISRSYTMLSCSISMERWHTPPLQ